MGLLGAAVANNASWCDAVCRSHGYPGTFSSGLWTSTRHRLRFYPNAITLSPEVTEPEVLAAATPCQPFAVKDSFARLDLALAGFRLLAEASWIVRDAWRDSPPDDGPPDDRLSWDKVATVGGLRDWETAWAGGGSGSGDGDGPLFQPSLLSDQRCAILACRREDAIIAGVIVYAADSAAGISNAFSSRLPPDRLWASIQEGDSLEAARQAGFHVLAPLRIWVRPSLAP